MNVCQQPLNGRQVFRICTGPFVNTFFVAGWLGLMGICRYASANLVAWGAGTFVSSPPDYNNYGQSIVPASETNAAFVAGGWRHSLALNANGKLKAWGDDTLGQTDFFSSATNWVALACGRLHSV